MLITSELLLLTLYSIYPKELIIIWITFPTILFNLLLNNCRCWEGGSNNINNRCLLNLHLLILFWMLLMYSNNSLYNNNKINILPSMPPSKEILITSPKFPNSILSNKILVLFHNHNSSNKVWGIRYLNKILESPHNNTSNKA